MAQALSPHGLEDALAAGQHLPPKVIEAINGLLLRSGKSNHITLKISKVRDEICECMGITKETLEENKHWLDFEPYYRAAGWAVFYGRPGYDETYEGFYDFRKPR